MWIVTKVRPASHVRRGGQAGDGFQDRFAADTVKLAPSNFEVVPAKPSTELGATRQARMVLKVHLGASVRPSEESWDAPQEAATHGVCRLGV